MSTLCGLFESYIILEDEQINQNSAPNQEKKVSNQDNEESIPDGVDDFDESNLPKDEDDDDLEVNTNNNATIATLPELIPLKKYLLLQSLNDFQTKLKDNKDVYFNSLDVILKFGKNFRYETLLMIATKLLDEFEEELKQRKASENKKK